jgi:hypothetical protein
MDWFTKSCNASLVINRRWLCNGLLVSNLGGVTLEVLSCRKVGDEVNGVVTGAVNGVVDRRRDARKGTIDGAIEFWSGGWEQQMGRSLASWRDYKGET